MSYPHSRNRSESRCVVSVKRRRIADTGVGNGGWRSYVFVTVCLKSKAVLIINHLFARASVLGIILCLTSAARAETTLLDAGYGQMYNLQFDQAHRTFSEWQRLNPEDPMAAVSDAAAYLFTEFDRLHILQSEFFVHDDHFSADHKIAPDQLLKQKFEAALKHSTELAARRPHDPNATFAGVLCHGLQSDYLALIEKQYAASFKEMKAARMLAEQLLAVHPEYYDAWIAVGVENYMLSVKPAPLRWLLRLNGGQTDRTLGIDKLRLTAERGHYLAPFARLLLAVTALRDRNTDRARELLTALAQEFPNNPLYTQELTRLSD
jgi:tetratricopeptide (TPR) repeat protein